MRCAFKEWAVVVDALGHGRQLIILRKGGIHEGRDGFQVAASEFLLFPTRWHQQRECVTAEAQVRYDELAAGWTPETAVTLEFWARVATAWHLRSPAEIERVRDEHIWRDEVIAERFAWGQNEGIVALALRVYRLPRPVALPMLPAYGGCKSWVEVAVDVPVGDSVPVLADAIFAPRLALLQEKLS